MGRMEYWKEGMNRTKNEKKHESTEVYSCHFCYSYYLPGNFFPYLPEHTLQDRSYY